MPQSTPQPVPPRPGTIAYKLDAFRRQIVGREAELAMFQEARGSELGALPFSVLFVQGPGGIGKTTLLRAYAERCKEAGGAYIYLNANDFEPNPEAFLRALGQALGLPPEADPVPFVAAVEGRYVILIDNFGMLEPLEDWLLQNVLPTLTADTLMVLASHKPLPALWRNDTAWRSLVRVISLRNFAPEESREMLRRRGVPSKRWDELVELTHGFPLALALVSDLVLQDGVSDALGFAPGSFGPEPPPDIVQALLERLLDRASTAEYRAALEVCALLRVTTEPALAALLGAEEAHNQFEWLRGLSFVENDRPGISPRRIARDTLLADLRWRSPDRYADLHRRARAYYAERLKEAPLVEQQRILWDYIFLHRDNALVSASFSWKEPQGVYTDVARQEDRATLAGWVRASEGDEAGRLFEYWWNRNDARSIVVFRERSATSRPGRNAVEPVGFLLHVALQRATGEDDRNDPVVAAARAALESGAPLRAGETATYLRFYKVRSDHHDIPALQSLIVVDALRQYLTAPDLAYSLFPVPASADERWAALFEYANMRRVPVADYALGSRRYVVYGHDWRVHPPMTWLTALAEKDIAGYGTASAPPAPPVALVVLSEEEFRSAVKDALRDMANPSALVKNPLLRSRIVMEQVGAQLAAPPLERASGLARLLSRTAQTLEGVGKRDRAYRALYYTYLKPSPTQESAADMLELPFSTYRRHLTEGITLVADALWQQEIGALTK